MYLDFYNLREHAFGETPDPKFLYLSASHREALASLFCAIETRRGFSALIAAPGMGKTTLLNRLRQGLQDEVQTIFFFEPNRACHDLDQWLMRELGVTLHGSDSHKQLLAELSALNESGTRPVLFIDEAQNLDVPVLERIRLLSNMETPNSKLLHILLSGQPQLAERLRIPDLCQLRQRISTICRLKPLDANDTAAFIAHRLAVAGYNGQAIFTPGAVERIAYSSRGIPRNINNVCANALTLAYAKAQKLIDTTIVREVIDDLDLASFGRASTACDVIGLEKHNVDVATALPAPQTNDLQFPAIPALPLSVARHELSLDCGKKLPRRRGLALIATTACVVLLIAGLVYTGRARQQQPASEPRFAQGLPGTVEASQSRPKVISDEYTLRTIEVQPNQTLESISRLYFGRFDIRLAGEFYRLNPELDDPTRLRIGQRIRLPRGAGIQRAPARLARLTPQDTDRSGPREPELRANSKDR